MVRGADGKEYGPVSFEQLKKWVQESRLKGEQEVKRSDMEYWAVARAFEELAPAFNSPGSEPAIAPIAGARPAVALTPQTAATIAHMRSGASWFYWVAGISLVNTVLTLAGAGIRFIFGLGVTQLITELANQLGTGGKGVGVVLNLLAAGVLVLFGFFSHKGHTWAFLIGIILFALDGVIFLLAQDWLGVGFHGFVLFCLIRGFLACRELKTGARA